MKLHVENPMYQTMGNIAYTLKKIALISREDLQELLNSGVESPTDGVFNLRIASLLIRVFEFDGLISYALTSKLVEEISNEELNTILRKSLKDRIKELYALNKLKPNLGNEPFQTVLKIAKDRDRLVHPQFEKREIETKGKEKIQIFDEIDDFLAEYCSRDNFIEINKKFDIAAKIICTDCKISIVLPNATTR
jgi:hypothetical protein